MMKNVLQIFSFLPRLFGYVEKLRDEKAKVNFKIYDVTAWTTNVLPYFPRSKGNQAMKFM